MRLALVITFALLAGCSKKREDVSGAARASASSALVGSAPRITPSRPPTGDGGSMDVARTLAMGKSAEGKLGSGSPLWFAVFPGPLEGQVKLEVKIPKDASRTCIPLRGRDAAGSPLLTLATVCSDDATRYSEGKASFGKDVAYFTIEPAAADARPSVPVHYRLSLAAN